MSYEILVFPVDDLFHDKTKMAFPRLILRLKYIFSFYFCLFNLVPIFILCLIRFLFSSNYS